MTKEELFQERVARVEKPSVHYTLLRTPDGCFLGVSVAASDSKFTTFDYVDDQAIWAQVEGTQTYRHVTTGLVLVADAANSADGCTLRHNGELLGSDGHVGSDGTIFSPGHGPAHLPSEYLATLKQNGWVALPCILDAETIEALERVSCTGRWESDTYERSKPAIAESAAVAKAATEPVSLWLIRQYMQTREIRLGHAPAFAILPPDDGERDVQGWHSDYPYHWGIMGDGPGTQIPVHKLDELVMGVQRNLCVSEFRKENGATCFKLGSHKAGVGPPDEWGTGHIYKEKGYRAAHGLPYNGPEADVVEAPAGTYIVYDSRLWHRAGVNRTAHKRAALLQAVLPMYIIPKTDTSRPYKAFLQSPLVDELTVLEQKELESLMVNKIEGPGGRYAITIDEELTDMVG
ncbi:phytanoyl-CoA dioxygenase family protein [Chloroflexi bacterium TSY]|nr:phytanoyl-CoA dioxygenase family protein [Chloroflexi bacterium TSY]